MTSTAVFILVVVVLLVQTALVYSVGVYIPASSAAAVSDRRTLLSKSVVPLPPFLPFLLFSQVVVSERVSGRLRRPGTRRNIYIHFTDTIYVHSIRSLYMYVCTVYV